MTDQPQERPQLRPSIDAAPIDQDGRQMLMLYDAAGLAGGPMALTPGAFAVVTLMNGQNTLDDIVAEFARQYNQQLPGTQLVELLNQLDRNGMLVGPMFDARYERLVEAYRQAPARPCQRVSEDADARKLPAELAGMIDEGQPATDGLHVVGVMAPHLDYQRGRPCYAEAYAQLRGRSEFERFVVLGTNHFGQSSTAVWTVKDYETPLGRAETDRDFIDRLRQRCGADLGEHEMDHLREHSVELQVNMLQSLFGPEPVRIVPILCPDVCGPTGLRPADGKGPGLGEFATALAEVIADAPGPTCLIAGADLSHVGRRFGDDRDLDEAFLQTVEAEDRSLLACVEAGDADGLLARLQDNKNLYRVCSAGCIYVLLRVVRGATVRMLRYHQAVDRDQHTGVTCAAAALVTDRSSQGE